MSSPTIPTPPHPGVTELLITSWAAGGRGLGRVGGRIWMVGGAMPGDRVLAVLRRDHGRWVEARLDSIVEPSPSRRTPPCPIQSRCGGCPLMTADERMQRAAKHGFVRDALQRIGGLTSVEVEPVVEGSGALGYRNKIELTFGSDPGGRSVLGFHRADDPSSLVDVPSCAVADARMRPLVELARGFFLSGPGATDPAFSAGLEPVRLVLRCSGAGDELLVALRGGDVPFPSATEFARRAVGEIAGLAGVVRILAQPGRRGGARVVTLAGRDWIADEVLGLPLRVPAATFLQVNAAAAGALARRLIAEAGSPRSVLELYGGVGAVGLALAARGARAVIVEADPAAVACGREAASRAGIPGVLFVEGDVERVLRAPPEEAAHPDLVVADPPRGGLGRGVAARIAGLGARRIAMVSCDPATLARDLALLSHSGYRLDGVTPFDLFPQTAHVEALAWLTRDDQGSASPREDAHAANPSTS